MEAKAFLFDLDGVLTNTSQYHFLAWKQLCSRLKLKFDEKDNHRLLGVSRLRSLEIILELNGCASKYTEKQKEQLADKKNRNYLSMIENITPDDLLPGIPKFYLRQKQKYQAGVGKQKRRFRARKPKIRDAFDYIADASKIANPKPHPEIFLNCSHALGIEPLYCIGFEDHRRDRGIHAAGMFSVGIGVLVTTVARTCSDRQASFLSLLSDSYSMVKKEKQKSEHVSRCGLAETLILREWLNNHKSQTKTRYQQTKQVYKAQGSVPDILKHPVQSLSFYITPTCPKPIHAE